MTINVGSAGALDDDDDSEKSGNGFRESRLLLLLLEMVSVVMLFVACFGLFHSCVVFVVGVFVVKCYVILLVRICDLL